MEIEGKTKRIISAEPEKHTVFLETKDILTAGNSEKEESLFVAKYKTTQAVNVFRLLQENDIKTSFIEQVNDNTMLCHDCDMIPIECVVRRFAYGSFLKRNSQYKSAKEFPFLVTEFFHKHTVIVPPLLVEPTQTEEYIAKQKFFKDGKWLSGVYPDPYLMVMDDYCQLFDPNTPPIDDKCLMEIPLVVSHDLFKNMKHNSITIFNILEYAFRKFSEVNISLVDMKIEFGIMKSTGDLVVSDVIDNDSWRLWVDGNPEKQLDKQCFRDGHTLQSVEDKYELVAKITENFNNS